MVYQSGGYTWQLAVTNNTVPIYSPQHRFLVRLCANIAILLPQLNMSIRNFLLELSKQFGKETEENLKVFVAHHGQLHDSGFLSSSQIEQCKTMFELLMALVDAEFMNPRDMSKLMDFLDVAGENALSRKVQKFQAQAVSEESK